MPATRCFARKYTNHPVGWAISRLSPPPDHERGRADLYRAHLPELVPFMTEPYTPQAVNQARNAFRNKVKMAGATFFYGALCGFFTPEELDDILFESSEVARFLMEIEGTALEIDEEIDLEDRVAAVMKNVSRSSAEILKERIKNSGSEKE